VTRKALAALDRRISDFLGELVAPLGRGERRHRARKYLDGLLLPALRTSARQKKLLV
jgi:hypothetical protein